MGLCCLGLLCLLAPGRTVFESDFEAETAVSPPPGWMMWGAEAFKIPAHYPRDTANPHTGQGCFRLDHPAATRGYVVSSPEQAIRSQPGGVYTVRFWARSDRDGRAQFQWTAYQSLSPYRDAPSPGAMSLAVGPEWRPFEQTISEGWDFVASQAQYLLLTIFPTADNTEQRTLWIDDVTVTETLSDRPLNLVDEQALTVLPVDHRLAPGDELAVRVDAGRVLRPVEPRIGGVSFHRVVGWTGQPYRSDGTYTLAPGIEQSIRDLHLPMTRFYGVGHEAFGVEESLDKVAELCRKAHIPLGNVVLELEEQSANRSLPPETWAAAARHSLAKGYGFRYWEVANEPYSSSWGADMGRAFPTPETYAQHVIEVAAAVHAVQPDARVGIAISSGLRWCHRVLAQAAGSYDFVVAHYYAGFGNNTSRTFEAITLTENYAALDRLRRNDALIRAYNPNRQVEQLDTEWGLHGSGPNGERADNVVSNANSWGMIHRAVRLIYYAREGLLAGASSWQMLSQVNAPGFGVLAQEAPDQKYLIAYLYGLFNTHLGRDVLVLDGTAPYYTPAAGEDPRFGAGAHPGPATPLVATRAKDGRVLVVAANGFRDRSVPCRLTFEQASPRACRATLLRQADPDGEPLVGRPDEVLSELAVRLSDNTATFILPAHSVSFLTFTP